MKLWEIKESGRPSDVVFLVSRKEMIHLIEDRRLDENCSPIRDYYVLFTKNNQGHPDDKRCNKYTLFKDILDTANCLIS